MVWLEIGVINLDLDRELAPRHLLPCVPSTIARTMMWMVVVTLTGSDLGELLGNGCRSSHANQRLETVFGIGASEVVRNESQQRAVGTSVWLFKWQLYLREYLLRHRFGFLFLYKW